MEDFNEKQKVEQEVVSTYAIKIIYKTPLRSVLLIFLLSILGISNAFAEDYDFSALAPSGQTLYYKITDSSKRTVKLTYPKYGGQMFTASESYYYGYTEPTGNVIIPSHVNYNGEKYTVISVGHGTFSHCEGLTRVSIPNSVTEIGISTFNLCKSLTSITIPNSVTSIGESAFISCTGLTSITIPNGVKSIGEHTFYCCTSLKSVTIPSSVKCIGYEAFARTGLTSVIIPNGVIKICDGAFANCANLTSVTISNTVTEIDHRAFECCEKLVSVIIQNPNLDLHFDMVFGGCDRLRRSDVVYGTSKEVATEKPSTEASNTSNIIDNAEIFTIVEQMPTFPGGDKALSEFISINIRYPQAALEKGIQGHVSVSFVVEPDGSLSDVKATRGIGSGCDEEAVRVVKSMPKWEPGKQRGQAVRVSYNLPVNFKLPK